MKAPGNTKNEPRRIATLLSLGVLDTAPEERFDRVTRLARRLFDVETVLVSLVDEHRQWFKSRQGLEASETSREISFCGHAILEPGNILLVPDARQDVRFHDNPLVTDGPEIRFYAGQPLRAPNGEPLGTLCLIDGSPRELDAAECELLADLARLIESELAALEAATIDPLTGLTNRLGLEMLASHALAATRRQERPLTLLFVDLDRFKEINDRFGHAAGDEALVSMGRLLRDTLRESDVVARLGGDEFCVLLTFTDAARAKRPLDALAEAVEAWNQANPADFELSYSVGCVEYDPRRHEDLASLLADADGCMYEEKRARRRQPG